jgi:hypothetical protein
MFAADLGASCLVIYFDMKTNTNSIVILWSLFTVMAPYVLILVFIRKWGHSEDLREDMIAQLECHFGVGVLAGICLACILMDVLLGNRVHVVYTLAIMGVAFIWCKMTMLASATDGDSKPSSTHSSTTEQTMITV